ncbi:MAG: zinc-binding dehydrogenase [Pantoea sp.]|nr:zinc-binding dehydrogenase [Pantoea sp. At-9b]
MPDAEKLARAKSFVLDGLRCDKLQTLIDKTLSLDAIAEAHRYMESNRQVGMIVVTLSEKMMKSGSI